MTEIDAIYWILRRELLRFWRDRARVISSVIQPLLFLIVLGSGLGFMKVANLSYQTFLFPGIVAISIVGISIGTGISVVWDREFGVLKEILVAPVSRLSIFVGKAVSGCVIAIIQATIILFIGIALGITLDLQAILLTLLVIAFLSLGLVSIGLIIASLIETIETFGVIMNFLVFPLIFLSGAFYPLSEAPSWLKTISYLNPVTFGIDALRAIILHNSFIPLSLSFLATIAFSIVTILIGSIVFNRQAK